MIGSDNLKKLFLKYFVSARMPRISLIFRHHSITTDEAAHLMLCQHRLAGEIRLAVLCMRFM